MNEFDEDALVRFTSGEILSHEIEDLIGVIAAASEPLRIALETLEIGDDPKTAIPKLRRALRWLEYPVRMKKAEAMKRGIGRHEFKEVLENWSRRAVSGAAPTLGKERRPGLQPVYKEGKDPESGSTP